MRELTFKGFLKQYVQTLSYQNTTNIYKLVRETAERNPRLYEPLFLYISITEKTEEFYNAVNKTPEFNRDRLLDIEITESFNDYNNLPIEYTKVHESYQYRKNRNATDNNTKQLMHGRIKKLQNEKQISNYRIYSDLEMNPGNFNSFIKHGDVNKYSLDKLREVISYLENL